MPCPKCGQENPDTGKFCLRCHSPLSYTCPSCKHVQTQGGKCEQCGLDFTKYAAVLQFQMKATADQTRRRSTERSALIKQILLLPITGGFSLFKYIRARLLDD
jgi:hypothetical protein